MPFCLALKLKCVLGCKQCSQPSDPMLGTFPEAGTANSWEFSGWTCTNPRTSLRRHSHHPWVNWTAQNVNSWEMNLAPGHHPGRFQCWAPPEVSLLTCIGNGKSRVWGLGPSKIIQIIYLWWGLLKNAHCKVAWRFLFCKLDVGGWIWRHTVTDPLLVTVHPAVSGWQLEVKCSQLLCHQMTEQCQLSWMGMMRKLVNSFENRRADVHLGDSMHIGSLCSSLDGLKQIHPSTHRSVRISASSPRLVCCFRMSRPHRCGTATGPGPEMAEAVVVAHYLSRSFAHFLSALSLSLTSRICMNTEHHWSSMYLQQDILIS